MKADRKTTKRRDTRKKETWKLFPTPQAEVSESREYISYFNQGGYTIMKKFAVVLAVVALAAFAVPALAANPFMDVPMNHWAYDAIGQLAAKGVLSGYPDGTYKGNQPTTRYEMASALARALAVVDMTKASKQDVEMLKKLVVEFKDELDALGVKVDKIDKRVAQLESDIGGWKITGSFRMDWKFGGEDDGQYSTGDSDLNMRTPNNWLQLVKRVDDKVSYRARLRRTNGGAHDSGDGLSWRESFITVKFPWEITARFGKMSLIDWEGDNGLYEPNFGDDSWFLDWRFQGMAFDKSFGMGDAHFFAAHDDGSLVNGALTDVEANWFGARFNFNFNETFRLAVSGIMRDVQDDDQNVAPTKGFYGAADVNVWYVDFAVNFTKDIAFRGMYAAEDWDVNNNVLPGGDDPKAWKAIVEVKQDALKFTSLWLEYSMWDASFASANPFLNYADGPGTGFDNTGVMPMMMDPTRNSELTYLHAGLSQKWNDQWTTFERYVAVDFDENNCAAYTDLSSYMIGVRYYYTPALFFEFLYDKVDYDEVAGTAWKDDNMFRFRTQVSF